MKLSYPFQNDSGRRNLRNFERWYLARSLGDGVPRGLRAELRTSAKAQE